MSQPHSSHSSRGSEKKSDFLCKWRFFNTLPDVPFDPKLLHFPFEKNRFIKYTTTALESQHKSILHTEADLGVPIDLIDPFAYKTPAKPAPLDDADAKLLQQDEKQITSSNGQKGQTFRPVASWLRKTEYISGAFSESRKDQEKEREPKQVHLPQKETIEESFRNVYATPKHPSKPHLTAVESKPFIPDVTLWKNDYLQVIFDREPLPEEEDERKGKAILRNYKIENQDIVAYMVPKKRKLDAENENTENGKQEVEAEKFSDDEEEYEWIRAYSSRSNSDFEERFFLVCRGDTVAYNRIDTRYDFSKFKLQDFPLPSKITVSHTTDVPPAVQERRDQKMSELYPSMSSKDT